MSTDSTERGPGPAASTTSMARVDAELHLSPRTVAWLADHPQARRFVGSVWDKLVAGRWLSSHPGFGSRRLAGPTTITTASDVVATRSSFGTSGEPAIVAPVEYMACCPS